MEEITGIETMVKQMVELHRQTHEKVSEELQKMFPGKRGLSSRSVRRFCSEKGIHSSSRLEQLQLSQAVANAISKVGPTYGRKTMKGYLASRGIRAGQRQIAAVLPYANPVYHHKRQTNTEKVINPIPYSASYFGHKVHIDQNEKLVMYGVTHVCGIDGYSGKIVGFASMPVKNTVEIYKHLFRYKCYILLNTSTMQYISRSHLNVVCECIMDVTVIICTAFICQTDDD